MCATTARGRFSVADCCTRCAGHDQEICDQNVSEACRRWSGAGAELLHTSGNDQGSVDACDRLVSVEVGGDRAGLGRCWVVRRRKCVSNRSVWTTRCRLRRAGTLTRNSEAPKSAATRVSGTDTQTPPTPETPLLTPGPLHRERLRGDGEAGDVGEDVVVADEVEPEVEGGGGDPAVGFVDLLAEGMP